MTLRLQIAFFIKTVFFFGFVFNLVMPWVWPGLRGQSWEWSWTPIWRKACPAQEAWYRRHVEQRLVNSMTITKALLVTLHFIQRYRHGANIPYVCSTVCPVPQPPLTQAITTQPNYSLGNSFCKIRYFHFFKPLLLHLSSFLLTKDMNILDIWGLIFCAPVSPWFSEGETLLILGQNLLEVYRWLGPIQNTGDTSVDEMGQVSTFVELMFSWGDQ